jgi:serine/threonine-protein kinase
MAEGLSRAEEFYADQRCRWRRGERIPVEAYLWQHPSLESDTECVLQLINNEVVLRQERAEPATLEEYLERFPQFAAQLKELFEVHRALEAASLPAQAQTPDGGPGPEAGWTCRVGVGAAAAPGQSQTLAPGPTTGFADEPSLAGLELREELGRGGMGIVLVCRDNRLGRALAVKVLRPEHRDNSVAQQRFLEEAQITAQLQHPGIVPVHQVGRLPDGRPYFTMKLVRGQTLADLLKARAEPGQDLPRWLAVFQRVCQALAYAHDCRVVHRDLKPANVMVGAFDEVQVMDWGLAKVLTGGAAGKEPAKGHDIHTVRTGAPEMASQAGALLGTPAYMAPEQARGEVDRVDARCDVFGLGAILCEILTGRPPYGGATLEEVARQARQGELSDACARLEGCGADEELVRLAQRCLAADPAGRPGDAGEVARAVTAYLTSVQERLRRAEAERAAAQARARAERRARRWTVVAAVAALAVVVLGGGGWWWWHQRAVAATAQVDLLLQQMDNLRSEEKWPEALAVARQANGLLATGGIPLPLQHRVREGLADADMVVRLENIRLAQTELKNGRLDRDTPAHGYAAAFRNYGIDVEALEPAEAIERIRRRSVRDHLAAVLEDWAGLNVAPPFKERLLGLAEQAGSEDYRAELQAARNTRDKQALYRLADSLDVRQRSALALLQLSMALKREGDSAAAVRLLRRAQQQYPGDFWLNITLGQAFLHQKPPQLDEAVRFYTAALALRSQNPVPYVDLGFVLDKQGRLDEAIALYEKSLQLQPRQSIGHSNLGNDLRTKGRTDEGIAHLQLALEFDRENAAAHVSLAAALNEKGQLDEALDHCRQALRIDPKNPLAHSNLGDALSAKGQLDEAVAALQEARRLGPDLPEVHSDFGFVLIKKGQPDEAIKAFQVARRLKPDYVPALRGLGVALRMKGQLDEAAAVFKEARRLRPDLAEIHFSYGVVLVDKGQLDAAIEALTEALRIKPDYADAHVGLGFALESKGMLDEAIAEYQAGLRLQSDSSSAHRLLAYALQKKGKFTQSLVEFRRGHELALKGGGASPQSAQDARAAERLVELDGKLPAILRGAAKPADAAECIELTNLCTIKQLPGTAARFFTEAFAGRPSLAEDMKTSHRYNAACAAALAGCGRGKDDPPLTEQARASWRRQALAWLRADLAGWSQHLSGSKPEGRAAARRTLEYWQRDSDLAGLREQAALAKLPQAEQQAWRQLWADVQQRLSVPGPTVAPAR